MAKHGKNGKRRTTGNGKSDDSSGEVSRAQINNYGTGGWWYGRSCEGDNPEGPLRRLLTAAERDVLGVMTFLVFATGNWEIQAAATWISFHCGGNPAPRTVEKYLCKFKQLGLIELTHLDLDNGNHYLVCSILMASDWVRRCRQFEKAEYLTEQFRKLNPPKREPQKRTKCKRLLSREQQLEWARRQVN